MAVLFGPTSPGPLHRIVLVAAFGATESWVVGLVQLKDPVEEIVGVAPAVTFNVAVPVLQLKASETLTV